MGLIVMMERKSKVPCMGFEDRSWSMQESAPTTRLSAHLRLWHSNLSLRPLALDLTFSHIRVDESLQGSLGFPLQPDSLSGMVASFITPCAGHEIERWRG
ncbi:hypothetical protein VNO77_26889 [Canavalia gladiata]|uniref:Uncharacterized protein n=1 Tax=Canavalia gladiata TaxID=3824 RepID=A0AAN9Q5Z9_CANGL